MRHHSPGGCHFVRRSKYVFTIIGHVAGKAESSCLKSQNSKHLKSWILVAIPLWPSPKPVNTKADRHVHPKRDQFTFHPDLIFTKVERQGPNFPLLERVDEIWHVETICYRQGGHLDFELRKGDRLLKTIAFGNNVLLGHSKGGTPYSMRSRDPDVQSDPYYPAP